VLTLVFPTCDIIGFQFNVLDVIGDDNIEILSFTFGVLVPDDLTVEISANTFFAFSSTSSTIPPFPSSQLLVQLELDTDAMEFCLNETAFFSVMVPVPMPLVVAGMKS